MPARSQAQRAYIFATKGEKFARAHHFDNKGPLPKHAPKRKGKSGRDQIIRNFQAKHRKHGR